VIEVQLSLDVLGRARFAYSPLAELACSLRLLAAQRVHPLHQPWYRSVRGVVGSADLRLLGAVCPAGAFLPDFLFAGAPDPTTTIEQQLAGVAEMPAEQLRDELTTVWTGRSIPAAARQLGADGAAGSRRLADALWEYWQLALEAHWPRIRSALDDDVSYRAARLTTGALYDVLADLHPEPSVRAGDWSPRVPGAVCCTGGRRWRPAWSRWPAPGSTRPSPAWRCVRPERAPRSSGCSGPRAASTGRARR
jgi:hypothetical protein